MTRISFRALLALALSLAAGPAIAQQDPGALSLERIFSSGEFRNQRFGPARWLEGGAGYATLEPSESAGGGDGEGGFDIVSYDAATGERSVLVSAQSLVPSGETAPLDVEDYRWSPDGSKLLVFTNSQRVWRDNTRGDYWVLDRASGTLRKLGGDAPESTLMFAKFSPDGDRVAYVRQNNLYVEDVASGAITQLTTDGSRTTINGTFDWVYEEELGLQDGWRWSPDGERIAYWQLDATGVRDFLLINDTDSLYSFTIPVQYPKAGETNSAGRVGVVSATGGETRWMQVPGDPRQNYIARMDWAASPDEIVMQRLNRLQNTLEIMLGDASTGQVRTIHTERDSAWVDMRVEMLEDEPEGSRGIQWLDGGREFAMISESDGWRHAWVISRDGSSKRLVTPGEFDIIDMVGVDEDDGWIYYVASPDDPTRSFLYRSRLDGTGQAERVTPADASGSHSYDAGPGVEWAFHVNSSFGTPPVTDLVHLPDHRSQRVLAANQVYRDKIAALDRGPVEFFRVDQGDGVMIDGWIMKPPDFDPSKRYPLLVHVYGEPWGTTVEDAWGGGDYLWHLFLTQQGYLVASVDPRGTPAPRGREWRKTIYRRIGTLTSRDIAGATRAIEAWPYVDPDRTAIWGWSGGGSQTLNSLFRYPDVFETGMAVAPVPDVRLYDTIYQERYMGLPQDNPEDYAQSSPLTYADRLEGNLLVVHGTGDDNVHYQGTERLINALVAANKPFQMMAYPNRTHGIFEGENTTLHVYSLLTRYLEEHTPPGPEEEPPASR
jgi:dipeptidyl-peptidase-4